MKLTTIGTHAGHDINEHDDDSDEHDDDIDEHGDDSDEHGGHQYEEDIIKKLKIHC